MLAILTYLLSITLPALISVEFIEWQKGIERHQVVKDNSWSLVFMKYFSGIN